jgi:FAD/FMN-containing dehydrogenase
VLSELGQVVKRNEGLAVERLLIGAEGTLGIITSVALSLVPLDGPVATSLVGVPDLHAATRLAILALGQSSSIPTALEVMSSNHAQAVCQSLGYEDLKSLAACPYLVLVELSAATDEAAQAALLALLETAAESEIALDAAFAQNETQRAHFWRVREDWAVDRERPGGLWYDISVPLSRLSTYIDDVTQRLKEHDAQLDLYLIGHLADGNLHVTVNASWPITERYDEIAAVVTQGLTALGGSYSAEHGIGVEKKATLERWIDPTKRHLMRSIKHLMDPHGILNPGKVIPN